MIIYNKGEQPLNNSYKNSSHITTIAYILLQEIKCEHNIHGMVLSYEIYLSHCEISHFSFYLLL